MLLKLDLSYRTDEGFAVRKAALVRWHKREGEAVEYGDPLLDLQVLEAAVPEATADFGHRIQSLNKDRGRLAELTEGKIEAPEIGIEEIPADESRTLRKEQNLLLRITASDRGVVRHVCAREGEELEAGDLLALISTDGAETPPEAGAPKALKAFKSVEAVIDEDPGARPASRTELRASGENYVFVHGTNGQGSGGHGIYVPGAQYMNSVFACAPLIGDCARSVCIYRDGLVNLPSEVLLQSLERRLDAWPSRLATKFQLPARWFESKLFEKTFTVPLEGGERSFRKKVVVLSIVPDVSGVIFRHEETGYCFDPVAVWSNRHLRATRPRDLHPDVTEEDLRWFRRNVTDTGPVTIDRSMENLSRIIEVLKTHVGAQPVVFNTVAEGPGPGVHNHQFVNRSRGRRRLAFNLALADLSRRLGFPIIDVDRLAKRSSVTTQFDWDEVDPSLHVRIGREIVRILTDLGIL